MCVLRTVAGVSCKVHSEWYASFKLGQNVQVFKTNAGSRPIAAGYPMTYTITIPTKRITQGVDTTPLRAAVEYRSPISVPRPVFITRTAVRDVTVPAGRCEANGRRPSSGVIYNIGG